MKPMKGGGKIMIGVAGALLIAAGKFLLAKWVKG